MTTRKKGRLAGQFDDFLEEQGIREEVHAVAVKRVIAWQIENAMKERGISKAEMARQLQTSRSQLARLLNPDDGNITLDTLQRAARIVGRKVKLELV